MIAAPGNLQGRFFSVTETLSVYVIISLSIFKSASAWHLHPIPTPTLTLSKSLLQQAEDKDSMSCLFPFALTEEILLLSNNRLMSCQPAENTQCKDQTLKKYICSLFFYSQWLESDCLCKYMKQQGGKKTEVCILLTENMSFHLLNCRWLGFKSHKSVTVLQCRLFHGEVLSIKRGNKTPASAR